MKTLQLINSQYQTPAQSSGFFSRCLPTVSFYTRLMYTVAVAARAAKKNRYSLDDWAHSSHLVLQALERAGVSIEVSGLEHLERLETPCVIIGNHMSMMETVILPAILLPVKKITFVVKESLLNYPVFKHVMRSSSPIAVTRTNPRQDLKTVMGEGCARLAAGFSVIVFPQTTRSSGFDPGQFSTIGVKLAQKAGVPVIPLALKTDCWSNGRVVKDLGRILPHKRVYVAFAPPVTVEGKGQEAQQQVIDFIEAQLARWQEQG